MSVGTVSERLAALYGRIDKGRDKSGQMVHEALERIDYSAHGAVADIPVFEQNATVSDGMGLSGLPANVRQEALSVKELLAKLGIQQRDASTSGPLGPTRYKVASVQGGATLLHSPNASEPSQAGLTA